MFYLITKTGKWETLRIEVYKAPQLRKTEIQGFYIAYYYQIFSEYMVPLNDLLSK